MTAPSLATRARRALDNAHVPRGARVLVACSGGLDSQVLLDVLAHVASDGRIAVVAHGVDHGLRAEASAELALAERLAVERGVPFAQTRVRVDHGSNLQARARLVRLAALRAAATAAEAQLVATGHHADDRAETVLIRLVRGAPLAGLAVLPARSQDLFRPLIHARRSELVRHASRRSLPFADDPSNLDRRFLRVRVRRELLPLLASLDPRIVEHLVRLAEQAGDILPVDDAVALGSPHESVRALAAVREAAFARNPRARVRFRRGATGRWDALLGVVITSPCAPADPTEHVAATSRGTTRRPG